MSFTQARHERKRRTYQYASFSMVVQHTEREVTADIRVRVHKPDYISVERYCLVLCALRATSKGGACVFRHVYRFGKTPRRIPDVVDEFRRLGSVPMNRNGVNLSDYGMQSVTKGRGIKNRGIRHLPCIHYIEPRSFAPTGILTALMWLQVKYKMHHPCNTARELASKSAQLVGVTCWTGRDDRV